MMLGRLSGPAGALALVLGAQSVARGAEGGFTLEAPGAGYLAEGTKPWDRPGALPAAAVYLETTPFLLGGLRLRSGILPGTAEKDRSGYVSLVVAARAHLWRAEGKTTRTAGPWFELGGGVNLTGGHFRPTSEAGLGWGIRIGEATLGPTLRIVQGWQTDGHRDTLIGLAGLEFGFSTPSPRPPPGTWVAAAPALPLDRDGDGILDLDDKCPLEAEDKDGFEDKDGCPDPDNDKDGIADFDDKCPNAAEDKDGFQDEDGCPDPDNDKDGIADVNDKCPNEPETVNGVDDADGCPDSGVIEVVNNRIKVEATVLFDQDRARVKTAARAHLAAIVTLWGQHPEWVKMIIEGHTDARGPARYNIWLSTERASRVRQALIGMGVAPEKLETKGMGATHPLDPGDTPEAHQRNRRVEFVIITAASAAPAASGAP